MYRRMMRDILAGIPNKRESAPALPKDISDAVGDLINQLEALLKEKSYSELLRDVARGDSPFQRAQVSGEVVNVIPGKQPLACTRLTVAMATGVATTGMHGFTDVMRAVRKYLIDCERVAEGIVLVTDTWSPRHIEEHLRDVTAHARQGRFVVPHLVTGKRIVRLDWPSD